MTSIKIGTLLQWQDEIYEVIEGDKLWSEEHQGTYRGYPIVVLERLVKDGTCSIIYETYEIY